MTKWPRGRAVGFVVVALLAAVGVSFLATAGPVFGQGPTVSIESGEIVQGGSGEVLTLSALNVTSPALCTFTVDIVYDPGVKVPTDCDPDPGNNFDSELCNPDYPGNIVRVTAADAQGVTGVNIPLADITWRAVGLAGAKTTLEVQIVTFKDCADPPVAIPGVLPQNGENKITAPPQPPPVTPTPSPTITPTATPTPTPTPTATATPEVTPTVEVTPTPEVTPTVVVTPPPVVTPTPGITPAPAVTPTPGAIVTPAALPPTGAGGLSDGGSAPWAAAVAAGGLLALLLTAASVSRAARRRTE